MLSAARELCNINSGVLGFSALEVPDVKDVETLNNLEKSKALVS